MSKQTIHESSKAKPLRVMHVINTLGLGGAEALVYRLSKYDRDNHHIVVSLGAPQWYSERLRATGVEVYHLHVDRLRHATKAVFRLRRVILECDPDVIQCWMYRSNLLGGIVGKLYRRPVVWGIHCSSLEPLRRSSRALARIGGLIAKWLPDFVINCSTRSAQLHSALGYSAAAGSIIHNGYDASSFFPDTQARHATRTLLGLSDDEFAIGTIARWHPQKDIPNFLEAIRLLREGGLSVRAFLIGAGLETSNAALMESIDRFDCRDSVTLLGPRGDIDEIARALDLHALASCGAEAFPNVVAESMLSGTPNVVTDVGDCAHIVGSAGWVVAPMDPSQLADAFAAAFREWRTAHHKWEKRRRAARQRVTDNFSLECMRTAYDDVWHQVTAAREERRRSYWNVKRALSPTTAP